MVVDGGGDWWLVVADGDDSDHDGSGMKVPIK
jgi:hypothetical protein